MRGPFKIRRARTPYDLNLVNTLHAETFPVDSPVFPSIGDWWLAWHGSEAVGFIGMVKAKFYPNSGYLSRVGVRKKYRGLGLQRRMMSVLERHARKTGLDQIVSDTAPASRSSYLNFDRCGYETFEPTNPWGRPGATYWYKLL